MDSPATKRSDFSIHLSYAGFALTAALASGLVLRETMVTFHGLEMVVGAYYGSWFLGIVVGALLARFGRHDTARRRFGITLALFPVAVGLAVVGLRVWKGLWGLEGDRILPLEGALVGTLVTSFPGAVLVGYAFPTVSAILSSKRPVSTAYVLEALGSVVGGVAFSFLFAVHFQPAMALGLIGVVDGLGAAWILFGAGRRRWSVAGVVVAVGFALLAGPLGRAADGWSEGLRWSRLQKGYRLIESRYSPYSHLALGRAGRKGGQVYGLFVDGLLADHFPDARRFAKMAAHVMAQTGKAPRRVLLMGGGLTGLATALLDMGLVERLDVVLADPWEVRLVRRLLPDSPLWNDGRVHFHLTDARRFVTDKSDTDLRYDAVISVLSLPSNLAQNRFFTVEFYRLVARLLPSGPFVQFFSRDEQASVPAEERAALASIVQTLSVAFGRAAVITGDVDYIVATKGGYRTTARGLAGSYAALRPTAWPVPPRAFPGSGFNEKLSSSLTAKLRGTMVPLDRDARPLAVLFTQAYLARLTKSRLGPLLLGLVTSASRLVWWAVGFVLVFFFVRRFSDPDPTLDRDRRATWALSAVGMASMALEIVLLVSFQQHMGALYRQVGLLGSATMAGLLLGALLGRWLLVRFETLSLFGLLVVIGLLALAYPSLLAGAAGLGRHHGLWAYLGLASSTGLVTGAAFPSAAALFDPGADRPRVSGVALEAADHLGAAVGAFLFGVVLFPVLGLDTTCRVVAMWVAVGAVPLLIESFLGFLGFESKAVPRRRWSFPWKRTSWLLAAVVLASYLFGQMLHPEARAKVGGAVLMSEALEARMRELAGSGLVVKEVAKPFVHLEAYRSGRLDAVVFSTRSTAPDVKGYAGPIELIVTFGADGSLRDVRLGENRETPSYVRGIPSWLAALKGWPAAKPLVGTGAPDTISGVTVTTAAILRILDRSRRAAFGLLEGVSGPPGRKTTTSHSVPLALPLFVGVFLAALLAVSLFGGRMARLAGLVASVAVLGLWLNLPISFLDLCLAVTGSPPSVWPKLVVFVSVLAMTLAFGQIWCGSMCPLGAVQEIVWLLGHPKGLDASEGLGQARSVPSGFEQAARYVKYLIAVLAGSAFFLSANQAFVSFDPLVWTFRAHHTTLQLIVLAVLLVGAVFFYRPWCRYLCPTGAVLSLGNKAAFLDRKGRRWIPACDLGVTSAKDVDCIRCNRCLKDR